MSNEIKDYDSTPVVFDREDWLDRLQPGTKNGPEGKGYIAVVMDRGPRGDRYRRPDEAFDSHAQHGPSGVFPEHLKALAYAERWTEARIAQVERIHNLRVRRGLGLGERLRELGLARGRLEDEAKAIARAKKDNEATVNRLVREANDPVVELDLRPSSDCWRLFDAPNETDGTLTQSRQLVLEHTGLDPIVPAVSGPSDDDANDEPPAAPVALHAVPSGPADDEVAEADGRKLPPSVNGADGKPIKPGQWVDVLKGSTAVRSGFMVEIDRFLKGGAFGVVVVPMTRAGDFGAWSAETPSHLANHQIRKSKKPRGVKSPEWPPEDAVEDVNEGTASDAQIDAEAHGFDSNEWPGGVVDNKGRSLRRGSWVHVEIPGGHAFDAKILGAEAVEGDGFVLHVEAEAGGVASVPSMHCRYTKRPKSPPKRPEQLKAEADGSADGLLGGAQSGAWSGDDESHEPAVDGPLGGGEVYVDENGNEVDRPGLNPADVVWPEDEEGPEL